MLYREGNRVKKGVVDSAKVDTFGETHLKYLCNHFYETVNWKSREVVAK